MAPSYPNNIALGNRRSTATSHYGRNRRLRPGGQALKKSADNAKKQHAPITTTAALSPFCATESLEDASPITAPSTQHASLAPASVETPTTSSTSAAETVPVTETGITSTPVPQPDQPAPTAVEPPCPGWCEYKPEDKWISMYHGTRQELADRIEDLFMQSLKHGVIIEGQANKIEMLEEKNATLEEENAMLFEKIEKLEKLSLSQ